MNCRELLENIEESGFKEVYDLYTLEELLESIVDQPRNFKIKLKKLYQLREDYEEFLDTFLAELGNHVSKILDEEDT